MNNFISKRELLTAGVGLGITLGAVEGFAQTKKGVDDLGRTGAPASKRVIPVRKAKTTKLFLSPPGWPNAITIDPAKGFWLQEQRHDGNQEAAWLVDWNGKLLHTVMTNAKDCSGMAYGDGYIWSGSVGESIKRHGAVPTEGIFQTDMNGKQISHRQIPFGPQNNGGACHGLAWENGKLWIDSNRLKSLVRIDPKTWAVDFMFPATDLRQRLHGLEYEDGHIWQVVGSQDPNVPGYEGYTPGLVKYDIQTGQVVQIVEFVPGSCDMHDVTVHNGQLYGVDAGEHPGWPIDNPKYQRPGFPPLNSPSGGYVFRIDLL